MSELTSKQRVLAVYPDAEVHSNDYYHHWIGRKTLSEAFEEDMEAAREIYRDRETHWEITHEKIKTIQRAAIDKAWDDAAAKLPSASATHTAIGDSEKIGKVG